MTHFMLQTWPGQLIAVYVVGYAVAWYAGLRLWQTRGRPIDGDMWAFFAAFIWPFALLHYLAEWRDRARPVKEPKELRRIRARVEEEKAALEAELEVESLRSQLEVIQTARINGVPYADAQPTLERGEVLDR